MKAYYDKRAPEYDDWYLGQGLFEPRERAGWDAELERLFEVIRALPPVRTLDVACGTGFLTKYLRGDVVGLDHSPRMLEQARKRAPDMIVDASRKHSGIDEHMAPRVLNDGSRWEVFKRYFTGASLGGEPGGGEEVLFEGDWFVVARARVRA